MLQEYLALSNDCCFSFTENGLVVFVLFLSLTINLRLTSGCWCPDGQVMSHMQRCVLPEECACEVAGVRYWPGQQMKIDCEICVCERGRPQRCQPNPDCSGRSVEYATVCHCRAQHPIRPGCLLYLIRMKSLSYCSALWLVVMVRVG